MRTLLASAVALGAFTSVALAEPLVLADAQMDAFTAGDVSVTQSNGLTIDATQSNTSSVTTTEGDTTVSQANTAGLTLNQSNSSDVAPPPAPAP
jgi:hypothetical protein